ncbi:MAG: hypothetical protein KF862_05950 [Chitinophagaceae bacterium]|nr:hypothetical protein [Chitinophagaceae bacterium]
MSKIKLGDIFEIITPKGNAYLHFIHKSSETGELIRVLQGLYVKRPDNFDKLVTLEERYIISFPLSAADKKKLVEHVSYFPISKFNKPKLMRTEYNVGGKFLGWHLVDTETWQRQLVKTLTPEQKKLSPWGIWNDTQLIESLINDWSLENWV